MKKAILVLIFPFFLAAQDAVVYDLTTTESADGATLHKKMKEAEEAYKAWVEKIEAKYAKDNSKHVGCCHENGHAHLDFSDDFKHAVPYISKEQINPCWIKAL